MTFDERVRALEHLGFNEAQTRFIVTVALHSGFCLRRHYAQLAGLAYGAGVRGFLDRLVARGLARRHDFRRDRGHVYHLHHARIYNAIGQDDNRNRRHTSPALIARKLMLLDYVLDHPTTEWISTEQDKVALFTKRFGVPLYELPHRVYRGRRPGRGTTTTTRYFVHKLPIGVQPDAATVTFVVLVTDLRGQLLREFLADHVPLLGCLSDWRIIAVLPGHVAGRPACDAVFARARTAPRVVWPPAVQDDFRFVFRLRDLADRDDLRDVTSDDFRRYHQILARYDAMTVERLLLRWRAMGEMAFAYDPSAGFQVAIAHGYGRFETHRLPLRYDRFGTRAGVS